MRIEARVKFNREEREQIARGFELRLFWRDGARARLQLTDGEVEERYKDITRVMPGGGAEFAAEHVQRANERLLEIGRLVLYEMTELRGERTRDAQAAERAGVAIIDPAQALAVIAETRARQIREVEAARRLFRLALDRLRALEGVMHHMSGPEEPEVES